ncbi:SMC-Scp complex subunit ScpB [Paraglaciecola marina]|uniref:SMC-Scp complex subunit ScpB n=1 Tax=Paraglaciecola marina TaxID=2500157 RepID=UPI00106019C7|nr:SMC-Scp complex subunit ScpB [Paraglaciecola marina]
MAKISRVQLKQLVESAIFVAEQPLSQERLQQTVLEGLAVSKTMLKDVLAELKLDYQARGIQLVEVATGYRFQSMDSLSPWLSKLWQEQAPRYSRASLETLSLIAYRQPITRGEIEDVRGVSVSSHIMKTLSERGWIKVVGRKEVPGRPSLYATTKEFLDYFSLKSLSELPSSDEFIASPESEEQRKQLLTMTEESNTEELPPITSEDPAKDLSDGSEQPEQLH